MADTAHDGGVIFVLFGVQGDLATRRIVPALFNLYLDRRLPGRFALLGIGHRQADIEAFKRGLRHTVEQHSRRPIPNEEAWQRFAADFCYLRLDLDRNEPFHELADAVRTLEGDWNAGTARKIYYLATLPRLFSPVARGVGEAGLARPAERASIVVEKPLGHDLESSREINGALRRYFMEEQIFRIDHFLGKETVQNILALRFANPMFEPLWNRRYIDHVAITVAEKEGVRQRGSYYEGAGALRDMVQNHVMQLLCLAAMEPPVTLGAEDVRNKKIDVLRALRPISKDATARFAARGQYDAGWIDGQRAGAYRDEPEVDPESCTETYAAVKVLIDNWRWQDVPFYLRTGKRLTTDVSEISVCFKDVPHRTYPGGTDMQPGRLVIQIQPAQSIVLKFMAKEPGYTNRLHPANMRFCYQDAFKKPSPEAYETLIDDMLQDDATLFMRADEVEAAWQVLTPILEVWSDSPPPDFPNYIAGTWGPESAEALVARDGRSWLTSTSGTECFPPKEG